MPSTKQIIPHDFSGGVNYGLVPHKVEDGQFIDLRNYRPYRGKLEQTDLIKVFTLPVLEAESAEDYWLLMRFWDNKPLFFAVREQSVVTFEEDPAATLLFVDEVVRQTDGPEKQTPQDTVILQLDDPAGISSIEVTTESATTFGWRKNAGTWTNGVTIQFMNELEPGVRIFFLVRTGHQTFTEFRWDVGTLLANEQYLTHCSFGDEVFWAGHKGNVMSFVLPEGKVVREHPFKGQYVDNFFNHLMVGRFSPTLMADQDEALFAEAKKYTFGWSDLERPDCLTPVDFPVNEAGYYVLPNESESMFAEGITGLKVFGQYCFVFTPRSVWRVAYVGLPTVMFTEQIFTGVGNAFHYGVVKGTQGLYFIGEEDFYVFNGEDPPRSVGGAIRDFFHKNYVFKEGEKRLFGEFDTFRKEAVWTLFVDEKNICFQLVYQETAGQWFIRNMPSEYVEHGDINCFAQSVVQANKLLYAGKGLKRDLLDKEASALALPDLFSGFTDSTFIVGAGETVTVGPLFVLLGSEQLYVGSTFLIPGVEEFITPFVETPDYTHGLLPDMKEIETLFFDGGYKEGDGFDIYVLARDMFSQPFTEDDWLYAGTWTPGLQEVRLSDLRLSGRVFRYRFVAKGVKPRAFAMRSWYEFVYAQRAEQ